ncbi:MAG: hypothetical protein CMQ53_03705 [Gammaproteobacteria bacterium]|nr:hypothetical protein [Gammaproteobacteria bacterium]
MNISLVMEKKMNHSSKWDSACIIGYGGHAKTKILPALQKAGIDIVGVVSRNPSLNISGSKIFSSLKDAILLLPNSTFFIIATPPNLHYSQAKILIEAKKDVFIEKPAFLSLKESEELSNLALKNKVVLAEMLMYLENQNVNEFINLIKSKRNQISNIECYFEIPNLPENTFRDETSLGNSLLSDIACYPLSLLAISGLDLNNLNLISDMQMITDHKSFLIEGKSEEIDIFIQVGLSSNYHNKIKIKFRNGDEISAEPFFYGREAQIKINNINGTEKKERIIYEQDAFELMFKRHRSEWISNQKYRLNIMKETSKNIERLGRQAGF